MHSLVSKVSGFTPPGNIQSNLCTRFANTSSILAMANDIPGQILLPPPKGINWKSCPLKSVGVFRNLSGLNLSGSSQKAGSLWIAHELIMTAVLAGMLYSFIVASWVDNRGTSKGTGGCILSVSLITAFKYFIFSRSSSFTYDFSLVTALISFCTSFKMLGCLNNSVIAHSSTV
uniref:Uncharacterized protein n=1 Tax=Opuntia streptacantha TaxID=393608 RepID=A0A7C9AJJ2_OPUST